MEYLRGKKIIVTGSTGFLGKSVIKKLREMGLEYIEIKKEFYNLIDPLDTLKLFNEIRPDVVFHLAADCGGIAYNVKKPADLSYNNLMMTLNIFNGAMKFGKPKIIMIGSVDSYPGNTNIPYEEKDLWDGFPEETSAYYGLAKRMNIAIGEAYYIQYKIESVHVLLMNLYGPNDHFDEFRGHVIPAIIKKIDNAKDNNLREVKIFGDGSPVREFVFVEDAAELIINTASINGFEYFNLGSGQLLKIWEVLQKIKREIGFKGTFVKDLTKPMGHPIKQFNLEKINRVIGDFKFTSFDEGLKKTINWYYKNVKGKQDEL